MPTSSNPRRTPVTSRDLNCSSNGVTLKKSALRKGATFHTPTSSPTTTPSSLQRSQSTFDDVAGAHMRRAASTISEIDHALSGTAAPSRYSSTLRDNSLPLPRGLLEVSFRDMMAKTSVKTEEGRRVLRPRANRQPSDSGIGSSIVTTPTQKRLLATPKNGTKSAAAIPIGSTITRSAAAVPEKTAGLSQKGYARITEHILSPLLSKPSLKDFHRLVQGVPKKIQKKEVACLRDLEKTLLYGAPDTAKSASLYLDFCLTATALIHTTVDQLAERDQTRQGDRPYSNGYFVDLCDQLRHYATLLSRKDQGPSTDSAAFNLTDEIKMYGGIAINGREAELIRITKEGQAFSLRDNREIENYTSDRPEGIPMFKRSMSQTLEDEEEIRRSMARRKKNPTPEELAPKVCKHPGCTKQFARPCDLTKHEKTHSRPWKCAEKSCKYHEQGWPTEKEMDRHYNDKHAADPVFYVCEFKPCPYKSKRESNCKQHMEKAHGWKYDRTKHNGKKSMSSSKSIPSAEPTPALQSLSSPTSETGETGETGFPLQHAFVQGPIDSSMFPAYTPDVEFFNAADQHDLRLDMDLEIDPSPVTDNTTPSTDLGSEGLFGMDAGMNAMSGEDIYVNRVAMPPTPEFTHDFNPGQMSNNLFPTGPAVNFPTQHQVQSHISPIGHGNAMLFTPASMKNMSPEFMNEDFAEAGDDFVLFDQPKPVSARFDMDNSGFFPDITTNSVNFGQPNLADFRSSLSYDLTSTNLEALNQMPAQDMDWSVDSMDYYPTQ